LVAFSSNGEDPIDDGTEDSESSSSDSTGNCRNSGISTLSIVPDAFFGVVRVFNKSGEELRVLGLWSLGLVSTVCGIAIVWAGDFALALRAPGVDLWLEGFDRDLSPSSDEDGMSYMLGAAFVGVLLSVPGSSLPGIFIDFLAKDRPP
jgi:hypothetical protein